MTVITNPNIKMVNNSVGRCPECKKFFGTKKLSADVIALVNKHGLCPSCLDRLNVSLEEEEKAMENNEMQVSEAVVEITNDQTQPETEQLDVEARKLKRMRLETIIVPEEGDSRIIIPGPRGVTKHQMIHAITRNIENEANIRRLAEEYPSTFYGSLRYVKKHVRDAVYAMLGNENDVVDEEKFNLTNELQPSRKGITYHQVIIAVEKACEKCDYAFINKVRKYFPEQFRGSMKYIAKKYHAVIDTALSMECINGEVMSVKKLAARA